MNHLKPGLNEPFYKWLDDVRRAIRKEKELKEKLAYYNVKLIGYKGVIYDRIGSAGTAGSEKNMYYWMDKIDETRKLLSFTLEQIKGLDEFSKILSNNERQVLENELSHNRFGFTSGKMNRTSVNSIKMNIARKWAAKMRYL